MVGKLVDGGQGHSVVKKVEARTETVRGSTREGDTHFTRGDYVIAVLWYHRYEGDSTGRTWVKDPHTCARDVRCPEFHRAEKDWISAGGSEAATSCATYCTPQEHSDSGITCSSAASS